MGNVSSLNNAVASVSASNASIIFKNVFGTKAGGTSLDVTGYPLDTIKAGHVIIKETATGVLKPMPLASGNATYDSLPSGHTYEGLSYAEDVPKSRPITSVLTAGEVNEAALPFSVASIKTAIRGVRDISFL